MHIEYLNARLKGMKSRLLDEKAMGDLMARPDVESVLTELDNTPYKTDIEKASVSFSGIQCIEEALRKNLSRNCLLILKLAKGEAFEKYIRILLQKWDIHNIKTILRGKNIHAMSDEILDCLLPAGELDKVTLIELVKQKDVRDAINLLAFWESEYSVPLTQRLKEYNDNHDLWVLEFALDEYYYRNALDALQGRSYNDTLVREVISREIDVTNIKTILRLIRDRIEPADTRYIFIHGGKELNEKKLAVLLHSKDIEEAVGQLQNTSYSFLAAIPRERQNTEKISVYEKELDLYLLKEEVGIFYKDPLSVAVAVGYLAAKKMETTNIRIISRCKMAGAIEEEITKELIYV